MIINFFLIVTVIQFSHTTCYTTQTILNLSSDGSNFQISTSLLFVELIIELLLCVTLCVALCQGHKRCCVSPSDSAVSLRVNSSASGARQDAQVIEKQEEQLIDPNWNNELQSSLLDYSKQDNDLLVRPVKTEPTQTLTTRAT